MTDRLTATDIRKNTDTLSSHQADYFVKEMRCREENVDTIEILSL